MTGAAVPKLLQPLTLGALELAHRAVMLGCAAPGPPGPAALATRGGLVLLTPAAAGADWGAAAALLRQAGAFLIAALPAATPLGRAAAAMAAGCDGIELDADGIDPALLLRRLEGALGRWGAARLGVRLRCATDPAALEATVELLATLNELELGFVHLVNVPSRAMTRRRLRDAFRWPLIASGRGATAEAIRLVESRWADAIGFAVADGPALLRRLRGAP